MIKNVGFRHPRTDAIFYADVNPLLTARQALEALRAYETGPFLPTTQLKEDYELFLLLINAVIAPDTSMGDAGVAADDVIQILMVSRGSYG